MRARKWGEEVLEMMFLTPNTPLEGLGWHPAQVVDTCRGAHDRGWLGDTSSLTHTELYAEREGGIVLDRTPIMKQINTPTVENYNNTIYAYGTVLLPLDISHDATYCSYQETCGAYHKKRRNKTNLIYVFMSVIVYPVCVCASLWE